jgi:penicillin amidase
MNVPRLLLRLAFGRRLPITSGELRVPGPAAPITIRRDRWGVPHVEAQSDADAWFGLGFCQGQDRAFQLEMLLRVARGTLAELVGPHGLALDRVSRRVGFRRAAVAQLAAQSAEMRAAVEAFVAGVNAGRTRGLPAKPHELALLRAEPTPWDAADVLAFLKIMSFLLPANWDVELARLRMLRADGAAAVRDLDPAYPAWQPCTVGGREPVSREARPSGEALALDSVSRLTGPALDLLAADLALFEQLAPPGLGSNNWVIAGGRTASGKPLLANDPHLAPSVPPPWYLAHVRTPEWAAAGAMFAGCPAFPIGHNGFACWGVTAGLTDTTDLFLETLGPDGHSVRQPDGSFAKCEVLRETIRVKGRPDVVEEILVTPRGPVISPLLDGVKHVVSLRAVWLMPLPVRGFLGAHRTDDFESFRRAFEQWPVLPLNVVYANSAGETGWQLVGQLPVRRTGRGMVPLPADAPAVGWDGELLPFERMPFAANPDFLATANQKPIPDEPGAPFLGGDFLDGYRSVVIREELAARDSGWTVEECSQLQLNLRSKPWQEMRPVVLALDPAEADARRGLELLRDWDGVVAADSAAAAVFELFVAELCIRVARAKAPKSWMSAVGGADAGTALIGHNLFADRRVGHLVRLLHEQPADWFARPWADELADALTAVVRFLRKRYGPSPEWWHWGDVRPLAIQHPLLGKHRLLGPAFNLPPIPCGGDMNTVSQAGCRPLTPTAPAHNMANLRAVFDTADWSNGRFALAGGQSGNPLSPHYDDQFAVWQKGDGIPIPWTAEDVLRAATRTLRLTPA